MAIAAILYEHTNFQYGSMPPFEIQDGQHLSQIPPPIGDQQASSMKVFGSNWITFWESTNYGDDQLWIAPPGPSSYWPLDNLHELRRPHGNHHWGDRIAAVAFSGPPTGDNSDRTIIWPSGHVTVGDTWHRTGGGIWKSIWSRQDNEGRWVSMWTTQDEESIRGFLGDPVFVSRPLSE